MKKQSFLFIILTFVFCYVTNAQTSDCGYILNLKTGTVFKNVTYNEKNEVIMSALSKVMINDGLTLTLSTETYQAGASSAPTTVVSEIKCLNGEIQIPIELSGNQYVYLKVSKKADQYVNYPVDMQAGMALKDIHCYGFAHSTTGDAFPVKFNIFYKERTVVGKDTVTTPAGTFECVKINYLYQVSKPLKWQTSTWISKEAGIVKTEYYTKGKLVCSVVLENIVK